MAGSMLPGLHWNESQFQGGHHSLCGVTAWAMVQSALTQRFTGTLSVYNRLLAARRCTSDGATTMAALEEQAHADGFTKTVRLAWNDAGYAQSVWQAFLVKHLLAGAAVIVQTNNGQALRDLIRGTGEDATGLQRHFFGVLGHNQGGNSPLFGRSVPFGFISTDGCNNAVNPIVNGARTRVLGDESKPILFYYPLTTIAATRPGALLAVYPKPVAPVTPPPPPVVPPTPTPPATAITISLSLAELQALESLLARLPAPK